MYRRLAVWASSGPARGSAGPPAGKAPADRGENVVQGFADLFREDKRRHLRAHERLDWKAWNLFLALLPPAGLYLTMSYARKDMDEIVRSGGESFRTTRASKKETGVARPSTSGSAGKAGEEIEGRLASIDRRVRDLGEKLERSEEAGRELRERLGRLQEDQRRRSEGSRAAGGTGWLSWFGLRGRAARKTEEARKEGL